MEKRRVSRDVRKNAKLYLGSFNHHAVKTYRESGVVAPPFLTSTIGEFQACKV
jgi:hypothetical protein